MRTERQSERLHKQNACCQNVMEKWYRLVLVWQILCADSKHTFLSLISVLRLCFDLFVFLRLIHFLSIVHFFVRSIWFILSLLLFFFSSDVLYLTKCVCCVPESFFIQYIQYPSNKFMGFWKEFVSRATFNWRWPIEFLYKWVRNK